MVPLLPLDIMDDDADRCPAVGRRDGGGMALISAEQGEAFSWLKTSKEEAFFEDKIISYAAPVRKMLTESLINLTSVVNSCFEHAGKHLFNMIT